MNQECGGISKRSALYRIARSENIDKGRLWLYVLLTDADSTTNDLSAVSHKMESWKTSSRSAPYSRRSRNATVAEELKS